MSLPRFLDRVLDAAVPILGAVSRDTVAQRLGGSAVTLDASAAEGPAAEAGLIMAANLLARLYPSIHVQGPEGLVERLRGEVRLINPAAELLEESGESDATLAWGTGSGGERDVGVNAAGWCAYLDSDPPVALQPAVPAALAAAALGVGEVFRVVFAPELGGRGRLGAQPGSIDLVTLGDSGDPTPVEALPALGEFALIGIGAVGGAAAATLLASGIEGTMLVVDDECIELSNLQRYVLTRDGDVGARKVDLLHERARDGKLEVVPVPVRWHAELADVQRPVLVALDSAEDRIGVQASLPGPVYNAFTQPADIGWSRHEAFGEEACLACLYVPSGPRPALFEQIAAALGQHPRRVLAYLLRGLPVGLPLNGPPEPLAALPVPDDAERWTEVSLLEDIASAAGVDRGTLEHWGRRPITALYQEGICGGALLELDLGEGAADALVPLAHQSALAGVMLASQLMIAKTPALAERRPAAVEGRYDVLTGLPQVLARPRARTDGCICADDVYLGVYAGQSR